MKVLFLDIDGVCNSEQTFTKDPKAYFPIDAYMAFLVGKIVLDTGCSVVLSSSWRHSNESVAHIEKRITPIIGKTPSSRSYPDRNLRGYEIQDWLDEHPEVERYAILDDDSDMLPSQLPNFFQSNFKTGITEELAKRITDHLNIPTLSTERVDKSR